MDNFDPYIPPQAPYPYFVLVKPEMMVKEEELLDIPEFEELPDLEESFEEEEEEKEARIIPTLKDDSFEGIKMEGGNLVDLVVIDETQEMKEAREEAEEDEAKKAKDRMDKKIFATTINTLNVLNINKALASMTELADYKMEGYPTEEDANMNMSSDDDDEASDYEEKEEDDDEDEEDEDYKPDKKNRQFKGKNVKVTKRGPGRPRKRFADTSEDDDEEMDLFDVSSYQKKRKNPEDLCPPLPPKKMKGGRRTMLKKQLPENLPEADVQLACWGFQNKKIASRVDPTEPVATPFKGTSVSHLLRGLFLNEEHFTRLLRQLNFGKAIEMQYGEGSYFELIQEIRKRDSFQLGKVIKSEHMNYVFQCFIEPEKHHDNTVWMAELGEQFRKNKKFSEMDFRLKFGYHEASELSELGHNVFYYDDFADHIRRAKNEAKVDLLKLLSNSTKLSSSLAKRKIEVQRARFDKFKLQENYEKLHKDITNRDPKFDEMSITGVRCVKMMMDEPYFKTEDGLLAFAIPIDLETRKLEEHIRIEKQKWTSKDLKALKQIIKESVVSSHLTALNARYLEFVVDSDSRRIEEMRQEGAPVDIIYQAPQKRRRGRPTKEETRQRDKYGIVYPVLNRDAMSITVMKILPKQLSEWRTAKEKRLRGMNFEALMKENGSEGLIDWMDVAIKLMIRTKKLRLESDCSLTYKHEVDPKINTKRITLLETREIQKLYQEEGFNWAEIADNINGGGTRLDLPLHTAYQCFSKYRAKIVPPAKPEWDEDMDDTVKQVLLANPGHWRKVANTLHNEAITKKVVVDRYKKAITPLLKVGAFSRVEDCLLLLTIQHLKDFVSEEGHFGSVLPYIPWRYETTWRDRAHNLFNDWIVPWTLEEDQKLLELAKTMKRNWQKISEQFKSFKNRKGCLTRYKILQKNLGEGKNVDLKEYHQAYSMTRYNVFQYPHLKEIVKLLKQVNEIPIDESADCKLHNGRRPSEVDLKNILLSYNRSVMTGCIDSIVKYMEGRDKFWTTWREKNGEKRKTFDRRTFHPDDPQSVASAIHIRGLILKNKELIKDLTDFEEDVYVHFGRFNRTKPLKRNAERPYLPLASFFFKMNSVKRIIQTTPHVKDEATCSKKWSKFDNSNETSEEKATTSRAKVVKKKAPAKGKKTAVEAKTVKKASSSKTKVVQKKASVSKAKVVQKKASASKAKVVQKKASASKVKVAKKNASASKAKVVKKNAPTKGKNASLVVRASTRIKANAGANYKYWE